MLTRNIPRMSVPYPHVQSHEGHSFRQNSSNGHLYVFLDNPFEVRCLSQLCTTSDTVCLGIGFVVLWSATDLHRTLTDNVYFRSSLHHHNSKLPALRNILVAVARHRPAIGYCQASLVLHHVLVLGISCQLFSLTHLCCFPSCLKKIPRV